MTAPAAPPAATAPPTTAVDRFLDAVAAGAVTADLYAGDVVLDAVVPNWRFAVTGPDAVAAEYARWFAHPARFEELRRLRTATGEVVEYTLCWTEQGIPHAGRHVHVLDLGADGRIVADHVWCGGRWPASLLAEMEGERASTERQRGRSGTSPESSIDTEMEGERASTERQRGRSGTSPESSIDTEMEGERASTERQRGRSGTSPESSVETEMEAARDAR